MEVIWGQHLLVMTRKRNHKPIGLRKLDLNERAITFEGSEAFSSDVRSHSEIVSGEARKMANDVVGYIESVSFGAISILGMKCYIKQAKNGHFYFLWADSIRIKPKNHLTENFFSLFRETLSKRAVSVQKHRSQSDKERKKRDNSTKAPPIITNPTSTVPKWFLWLF